MAHDDASRCHPARACRQRHADDRRQQLRRQADGQRDGEQHRLDPGTPQPLVDDEHEQHHHHHHANEQHAELLNAAREFGLGRRAAQSLRHGPEGGALAGVHDEHGGRAAAHRRPQVDRIRSTSERRAGRQNPGLLFRRERLAGEAGFGHQEVAALEHEPVGRDQVAGRQHDDVAGHQFSSRNDTRCLVAQGVHRQRESLAQLGDRFRGTVFLQEAKGAAAQNHGENDRGVEPVTQARRHGAAEDEDQDQRALELRQGESRDAAVRLLVEGVGAFRLQASGRLG